MMYMHRSCSCELFYTLGLCLSTVFMPSLNILANGQDYIWRNCFLLRFIGFADWKDVDRSRCQPCCFPFLLKTYMYRKESQLWKAYYLQPLKGRRIEIKPTTSNYYSIHKVVYLKGKEAKVFHAQQIDCRWWGEWFLTYLFMYLYFALVSNEELKQLTTLFSALPFYLHNNFVMQIRLGESEQLKTTLQTSMTAANAFVGKKDRQSICHLYIKPVEKSVFKQSGVHINSQHFSLC